MTQDNLTNGTDTPDESVDDSPVIKALRKQVADLNKALKDTPSREDIEADIRTQLERESAISAQLVALGHPAGMAAFLKGQLGDAEVTLESVTAALEGIGYQVAVPGESSDTEGTTTPQVPDLARVSSLSASVQAAAKGDSSGSLTEKIAAAQSREEVTALMAEAGLVRSMAG